MDYRKSCVECAVVKGTGKVQRPPLHPIPVQRPFQILGVDIMELPITQQGNRYVIVFQDFLTKWPLVYPAPDQKSIRIAKLLAEEVVPMFGVPEALLSDRGTNLLSHLMQEVCELLGVTKLNTTAYHPACNGMVERLNRTLKAALRKHAAKFGSQWDTFLPGVLWAYRNTPHDSTHEKPSFLLFGMELRSPTEAALLPTESIEPAELSDYREQLMLSLSSARELAASNIRAAQRKYKHQYDKKSRPVPFKLGYWVLVRFPQEESGKQRKLSRPWHGPYRIIAKDDQDVTMAKVYFPEEGQIQVHQSQVCSCPPHLPAGFYWYGGNRKSPGRTPQWVQKLFCNGQGEPNSNPEVHEAEKRTPEMEDSTTEPDPDSVESEQDHVPQPVGNQRVPLPSARGRYSLRDRIVAPQRLV